MRKILVRLLGRFPVLKRRLKGWHARFFGYPDWPRLLGPDDAWRAALSAAKGGDDVLVATSVGSFLTGASLESLLAAALTVRGARVHVLLCDGVLPACLASTLQVFPDAKAFAQDGPRDICRPCFEPAEAMYRKLGVEVHRYGDLLTAADKAEAARLSAGLSAGDIASYKHDGVSVGEHALAGALRFFARGDLAGEPQGEAVLRRYFQAALLTSFATRRLMAKVPFRAAVFHHGIYVPQGVIVEEARRAGARVVTWSPAYRKKRFIFSEGDTYHHTLMTEPVSAWEDMPWTPRMEEELMRYLRSRFQGSQDWIYFHEKPREDADEIARETGVDFSKPCVGLLTNVIWDAQLHYPNNLFPSMMDWILETIRRFEKRPDVQLVIRVHPAELKGKIPSRQRVVDEVAKAFPVLPPNVFLVGPESRVSTYELMFRCNAVAVYGTKTGVELSAFGVPVIVAGEAWVKNKGFTWDPATPAEYFRILDSLPWAPEKRAVDLARARKYAYHFFFRRMIPLSVISQSPGDPPFRIDIRGLDDLKPGRDRGLDTMCDAVLKGSPCVYHSEKEPAAAGAL